jgi:hypothetical protein
MWTPDRRRRGGSTPNPPLTSGLFNRGISFAGMGGSPTLGTFAPLRPGPRRGGTLAADCLLVPLFLHLLPVLQRLARHGLSGTKTPVTRTLRARWHIRCGFRLVSPTAMIGSGRDQINTIGRVQLASRFPDRAARLDCCPDDAPPPTPRGAPAAAPRPLHPGGPSPSDRGDGSCLPALGGGRSGTARKVRASPSEGARRQGRRSGSPSPWTQSVRRHQVNGSDLTLAILTAFLVAGGVAVLLLLYLGLRPRSRGGATHLAGKQSSNRPALVPPYVIGVVVEELARVVGSWWPLPPASLPSQ